MTNALCNSGPMPDTTGIFSPEDLTMRRLLMSALALCSIHSPALAQQPGLTSLDETTAWLTEKLNTSAGYVTKDSGGASSSKIENVRFEGCGLTFDSETILNAESASAVTVAGVYKLALADINPDSRAIQQKDGFVFLTFKTRGARKAVRFDGHTVMLGGRRMSVGSFDEISIPFTEKDLAERVGKAFSHAATLCSKKKEPF